MNSRHKLLSTLGVLAFGVAFHQAPTPAQAHALTCSEIEKISDVKMLQSIVTSNPACATVALSKLLELSGGKNGDRTAAAYGD
jgi:hypothetical protein